MKENNLPRDFDITVTHTRDDGKDLDEIIGDAISDEYGYTHNGFKFNKLDESLKESRDDYWIIETSKGIYKVNGKIALFDTQADADDFIDNNELEDATVMFADEDDIKSGYKMNESLKEDWVHFTYMSGANPYIAKTEKETKRILNKYKGRVRKISDTSYKIDDIYDEDDYDVNESLKEQYWIEDKEVMAEVNRISKDLESKGYKYANRPLHSGSMYYDFYFKKIGDNEFDCKAIKYNHGIVEVIDVDVEQMMGREPIDDFDRMRRGIGKKLFGESKKENDIIRIKPTSKNIEIDVKDKEDKEHLGNPIQKGIKNRTLKVESVNDNDEPWDELKIKTEVKSLTMDFKTKSGEMKTAFDEEKDLAVKFLKDAGYESVNADRQGGKWIITYNKDSVEEHIAVDMYDQLNDTNAHSVTRIKATPDGKVKSVERAKVDRVGSNIATIKDELKENKSLTETKDNYRQDLISKYNKDIEEDTKALEIARREKEKDPKHAKYFDTIIRDLESSIEFAHKQIEKLSSSEPKNKEFDVDALNSNTMRNALRDRNIENRKALERADVIKPTLLKADEQAYKNLARAAEKATEMSPLGYLYIVQDTYLDFGANWQWTTLVAYKRNSKTRDSYQALNQNEWEMIANAKSDADIDKALDDMFNDEFNPDKESKKDREDLESVMWELSDLDD